MVGITSPMRLAPPRPHAEESDDIRPILRCVDTVMSCLLLWSEPLLEQHFCWSDFFDQLVWDTVLPDSRRRLVHSARCRLDTPIIETPQPLSRSIFRHIPLRSLQGPARRPGCQARPGPGFPAPRFLPGLRESRNNAPDVKPFLLPVCLPGQATRHSELHAVRHLDLWRGV